MLRLNFFLALGYFLGGYLGTLITIPPSHASSIWPAAGIALAGIVTYGRSVIPGIWLGAFFTQVYAFLDIANSAKYTYLAGYRRYRQYSRYSASGIGGVADQTHYWRKQSLD